MLTPSRLHACASSRDSYVLGLLACAQGWGGPACAKLITAWFGARERGTYWGLWNISHNFGAFLAPLIAGTAALKLGWRFGVWVPGIIALTISSAVVAVVRDSPESLGRIGAEEAWAAKEDGEAVKEAPKAVEASAKAVEASASMGMMERLRKNVLSKPQIWVLALSFLCVYLMRQVTRPRRLCVCVCL